jgi:hypothetical protein
VRRQSRERISDSKGTSKLQGSSVVWLEIRLNDSPQQ